MACNMACNTPCQPPAAHSCCPLINIYCYCNAYSAEHLCSAWHLHLPNSLTYHTKTTQSPCQNGQQATTACQQCRQQQPGVCPATRVPVLQMLELPQLLECVSDAWTVAHRRRAAACVDTVVGCSMAPVLRFIYLGSKQQHVLLSARGLLLPGRCLLQRFAAVCERFAA
jgi:hypothetical protein